MFKVDLLNFRLFTFVFYLFKPRSITELTQSCTEYATKVSSSSPLPFTLSPPRLNARSLFISERKKQTIWNSFFFGEFLFKRSNQIVSFVCHLKSGRITQPPPLILKPLQGKKPKWNLFSTILYALWATWRKNPPLAPRRSGAGFPRRGTENYVSQSPILPLSSSTRFFLSSSDLFKPRIYTERTSLRPKFFAPKPPNFSHSLPLFLPPCPPKGGLFHQ